MRVFATGFVAIVIAALCYSVCDARTYTVAPGDTITSIAESHNVSVDELARLNQLEGTDVRPGTVLVLDEETSVPLDPKVVAAARKAALAAESTLVPSQEGTDVALWAPSAGDPKKSALRRLAEGIAARTTQIAARSDEERDALPRRAVRVRRNRRRPALIARVTCSTSSRCSAFICRARRMRSTRSARKSLISNRGTWYSSKRIRMERPMSGSILATAASCTARAAMALR